MAAPISTPGVYEGGSFGDVYIMKQQQQQQNEGDIASDPAHYPYGDKHDLFFSILKYLFLNIMSALEINHVFIHDASIISGVK